VTHGKDTLLEFPCQYAVKAFGQGDDFEAHVVDIVKQHIPPMAAIRHQSRPSKSGKYIAATVTITATSKAQLDAIYQQLTADLKVVMSL
jgi:putative lipoic acid-binding regulatory protein